MFLLVFLLSVTNLQTNFAICRQSYATFCDSFDDLKNYQNKDEITELIIGSDVVSNDANPLKPVHLMKMLDFSEYNSLNTLTILRSFNKLEATYAYQCDYEGRALQFVNFYGNEFKEIEPFLFPRFNVTRFSLRNNQIEVIKAGTFTILKTEEFDASDNRLEIIESNSLPKSDATTVISLQNNKISYIEADSFGQNLKSLKLSRNKLRHVLKEALVGLSNLEELNLSHNRFIQIPDIQNMTKLIIFDISYNEITTVDSKMFNSMKDLKLLDLSGNKIQFAVKLKTIIPSGVQSRLTLSLAYNNILFIDTTDFDLKDVKLILHGNPFDCEQWDGLQKQLEDHTSKCEEELWASGSVPFCLKFVAQDYWLNTNFKKDVVNLHEVVRTNTKNITCQLTPLRYHLLKTVRWGCVA